MDDELRLGFHRLGRLLEDPVNMGVGAVVAWAIAAVTLAIPLALTLRETLLLILAGVVTTVALRNPITHAAAAWRRGRLALEREGEPGRASSQSSRSGSPNRA